MGRAEIRAEKKQAFLLPAARFGKLLKQSPGVTAQVYNGAHTALLCHFFCNIRQQSILFQAPHRIDPVHLVIQVGMVRQKLYRFPYRFVPFLEGRQGSKLRLSRRGKEHRAVVALAKPMHRPQRGRGQLGREALGFVKQHHTVGNVMELPAGGRAV